MTTLAPPFTTDAAQLQARSTASTVVTVVEDQDLTPGSRTPAPLTHRDRAILRAVAAGRCTIAADGTSLAIDGVRCCDQFVGARLADAGLVTGTGFVTLTARGWNQLSAL